MLLLWVGSPFSLNYPILYGVTYKLLSVCELCTYVDTSSFLASRHCMIGRKVIPYCVLNSYLAQIVSFDKFHFKRTWLSQVLFRMMFHFGKMALPLAVCMIFQRQIVKFLVTSNSIHSEFI